MTCPHCGDTDKIGYAKGTGDSEWLNYWYCLCGWMEYDAIKPERLQNIRVRLPNGTPRQKRKKGV